jgi:hypothetical protein
MELIIHVCYVSSNLRVFLLIMMNWEDCGRKWPWFVSRAPQGPTIVGTGSGTPEVPELPSARGVYLGHPVSGDHKYGDLVLQVGGWAWG